MYDCIPDPRCTASASDQNVQKNVMGFGPMTDVGVSKKGRRRGSLDINQLYVLALQYMQSFPLSFNHNRARTGLLTGSEKGKYSHGIV